MTNKLRKRSLLFASILFVIATVFIFSNFLERFIILPKFFKKNFIFGLDIVGGSVLTYQADLSQTRIPPEEALSSTKDLIERRINSLGVAEVSVSYTKSGKILVEVPGYTDPDKAAEEIGATPLLEFYIPRDATNTVFEPSGLTGSYVKKAEVQYNPNTFEPVVAIEFNEEGKKKFAELTQTYLQRPIAIYLDKQEISRPIVREVITEGKAVIEGRFTLEEAKLLARRLNAGSLPLSLQLVSKSSISPLLGEKFLKYSIISGLLGLLLVILLLTIFYRLAGLLSFFVLIFYLAYNLAFYKIFGVTISLASIAGLVLSLGISVDAFVLFYARLREELRKTNGKFNLFSMTETAFKESWPSIRDSNLTTLISALILYSITTSFAKGFALTLMLGIIINLFLVIFVSRYLLLQFSNIFEKYPKLLP